MLVVVVVVVAKVVAVVKVVVKRVHDHDVVFDEGNGLRLVGVVLVLALELLI